MYALYSKVRSLEDRCDIRYVLASLNLRLGLAYVAYIPTSIRNAIFYSTKTS